MTVATRIDLDVPYPEKDAARALGARWDPLKRTWFVPADKSTQIDVFARWLPAANGCVNLPAVNGGSNPGIALSQLLQRIAMTITEMLPDSLWVRAEISELREKRGHVFLTVVEHDGDGAVIARADARIWEMRAAALQSKFKQATGQALTANIKVLFQAQAQFHPQYGLSLIINDIDPSYTLGDMAAKLAQIRRHLTDEGLIARNKSLTPPLDFTRVAVISPPGAAGLGDFMREADVLQQQGLCGFSYFQTVFQGTEAASSLTAAIEQVLQQHRVAAFDALVILRGGGAAADLAWLNALAPARAICLAPLPVMTGIGHERDSTILDEVACLRFDTPSKIAQHIWNTITSRGLEAERHYSQISQWVDTALEQSAAAMHYTLDYIQTRLWQQIRAVQADCKQRMIHVQSLTQRSLDERRQSVGMLLDSIDHLIRQSPYQAAIALNRCHQQLQDQTRAAESARRQQLHALYGAITAQVENTWRTAGHTLNATQRQLIDEANHRIGWAERDLTLHWSAFSGAAAQRPATAKNAIDQLMALLLNAGPEATLKRGFAVARGGDGRVVNTAAAARCRDFLNLEFHDGVVGVRPVESYDTAEESNEQRQK